MLLVTPVAIIKVSYNKNTVSCRRMYEKNHLMLHLIFCSAPYGIKYKIILLKYSKFGCVYVVFG